MRRNLQLDVLRGIAILLVIGAHIRLETPGGFLRPIASLWHSYGGFGVPLFFALSGYLIGGLLMSELRVRGDINVGRFLIRRGLKIYPAYFVFLLYLVAMPCAKGFLGGKHPADIALPLLNVYWPNAFFLNNYVGSNPAGHTWSLAVEEHFYLMLPFLIRMFARRQAKLLIVVCFLSPLIFTFLRLACAVIGDYYIHDLNHTMAASHLRIDGLLIGVGLRGLAEVYPTVFAGLSRLRYLAVLAGCLCLASAVRLHQTCFGVPITRILPLETLAAFWFLLGTLHIRSSDFGRASRLIRPGAHGLAWIGFYSYSLYLWHTTALGFAGRVIVSRLPWSSATSLIWVLYAAILTTCVVALGWLTATIVEWPVIRLRDRMFPSSTLMPAQMPTREIPISMTRAAASSQS